MSNELEISLTENLGATAKRNSSSIIESTRNICTSTANHQSTKEYNELLQTEKELDEELKKLRMEIAEGPSVKDTMHDLHEYNDIKDSTQIVLGAMAEMYKSTVAQLHKTFNLPTD
uniref:DNA repair protein SWI5 homolog n=1 Tax=Bracon brevicornis TaxID=1563983 RepID=A0A6V7LXE5_9HYME